MRDVAIVGVGCSRFGVRKDVNFARLSFEAVKKAFEDSSITGKDVEFLAVGSVGAGGLYEEALPAVIVAEYCGMTDVGLVRCEAACASGSAAFFTAYMAVANGLADLAVAVGVEKMTELSTSIVMELLGRAGYYLWEFHEFGPTFPAYYALYASSHMEKFGTTEEDLALVAVKNHRYGALNPLAHLQNKISVNEVLASPVIAWPLKLYDCCPISDGAAVVVLASREKMSELKVDTPVWVGGVGFSSGTANLSWREDYVGFKASVLASRKAYRMAGVKPKDVDVACVHDCFTIAEIMAYEDLGFCEKGKGAKLIREGETEIGGRVAVNVDGGLKAKGHPVGATGCGMIYELVKQLREDVEKERQVPLKNYVALAHNVGGVGHYCYVTILRR